MCVCELVLVLGKAICYLRGIVFMRTVSCYITMLSHLGAVVSPLCLKDAVLTLFVLCIIIFNGSTVSRD